MTIDDTEAVDIGEEVRAIVALYGQLVVDAGSISDDDDLFRAGMSSLANVNVMLALEEKFGIEFPEDMLNRSTFATRRAISRAVGSLLEPRR